MRIMSLITAVLLTAGCTSLEISIDNPDDYDVVPIVVQKKFFSPQPKSISIMNCALIQKKWIDQTTKTTFAGIGTIVNEKGGIFEFKKDAASDYTVEILGKSTGTVIGSLTMYSRRRHIRFQKKNGVPYEMNEQTSAENPRNVTFTIYNESIGKISFTNYRSKIETMPEWEYDSGFVMNVNDAEYGIIAYVGKPAAYLKKGWHTVPHTDMLMMYLLAMYENYVLMKDQ